MAIQIQVKRGTLANRPALASGEFYYATDTAQLFVGPTPTLVGPTAGSGGAQGTTLIDFGAFPGGYDANVVVTGQASIVSGSFVQAFLIPVATVDHSADEHLVEAIDILAGNIVAGTGFTIYAVNRQGGTGAPDSPRVYGKWTVAWKWS